MSDQKKPCSHLDDCWTYAMTGLRHGSDVRSKVLGDEREIFYPDRAGWGKQVVMQDIVGRLEAEGATVVRRKGVIIAVFDEDG